KFNWPLQRGFDRFYGTITGAGSFFDPGTLTRGNTMVSPFTDKGYPSKEYYYTDAISDHAVRYINDHAREKKETPFFLYVAYTAAHWPMHALPKDIAKYKGRYDAGYGAIRKKRHERVQELGLVDPSWDLTPQVGNWEKQEHKEWEARCMEVYAAMVDNMDQGIGRIVKSLESNGLFDDTLILYMQDNGGCQEGVGRGGNSRRPAKATLPQIAKDAIRLDVIPKQDRAGVPTLKGPYVMPGPADTYIAYGIHWANVSNTPFREYKHFVHEGGVSTPLVAHWPNGLKRQGELESQPGHLVDIMATCVDLAKAEYPSSHGGKAIKPMEGVSLAPAFSGKSLGRKNPIFWEHEGNRAIRKGKWKLVAKENRPWELYDIENDRTEMHNLANKKPQLAKELASEWGAYAKRANVLPLGGWRGKPKATKYNRKQRRFQLGGKAKLSRERAPFTEKRDIFLIVKLTKWESDGVLVAQGGSALGYSLFVKDGVLQFATRHQGKLSTVSSKAKVTKAEKVVVEYRANGSVTISVDGTQVAKGEVPGAISMPVDGLEVGRDEGGAVGGYSAPFAFEGGIESVVVELGDAKKKN
ncbi:MAG: sulfatase-like hydrolase/transferase, partial [Planctomycetota bacterium]